MSSSKIAVVMSMPLRTMTAMMETEEKVIFISHKPKNTPDNSSGSEAVI